MTTLKKATITDIELIRELAEKSWNAAYSEILSKKQIEYMLSEMYSAEEISSHLQNPNYQYHLIFNEEIPVGFIGFEFHYEENTTKLHRIYLLPEAKGKGIGKTAMNFLKEKVAETSDNRIILNVNKENNARKVYE
ncbi:GNAT family N-acetyltransferase, partial [Kaistella sp.]|uniref:GNAT family N-acetyltransferase n=1 Tax=Kaistella sp. TaxID=2782235 RepID=UPI003C455898